MNKFGKVIGINLLIILAYSIITLLATDDSGDQYSGMSFGLLMILLVCAHAVISLIMGIVYFVKNNKELGKAFLIAAPIILLIGFSSCFGGLALL